MTDDVRGVPAADEYTPADAPDERATTDAGAPPQYGVGPFSVREVVIGGVWLVAFVLSFLPVFGNSSLWGLGLTWVLTIGVPTVAVFLLVLRRLSPDGIRRVGSLGIDQFASVAFSVSAAYWLTMVWQQVSLAIATGTNGSGAWLIWVEFLLMLAGVVFTVVAPFLPVFGEDFRHRPESPAHPNVRRLRPVTARPATERPARPARAAHDAPATHHAGAPAAAPATGAATDAADETETTAFERLDLSTGASAAPAAEQEPVVLEEPVVAEPVRDEPVVEEPVVAEPAVEETVAQATATETTAVQPGAAQQAFWALAPEERDVLDASGAPLFRIGPTAWALVIEDRGEVFVVRHEDGRIGYLHDVSGVTRG